MLQGWEGNILSFVQCPAVDNQFLKDVVGNLMSNSMPQLVECPFTPSILRNVGDQRFDSRYLPHNTIKVTYPGVPAPEEVRAWAKGWVKWFTWEDRKPQPGHDYDNYFVGEAGGIR